MPQHRPAPPIRRPSPPRLTPSSFEDQSVEIPAERIAALRFSGRLTPEVRAAQARILADVLAAAPVLAPEVPFDEVRLVPFAGSRAVWGFNGQVMGALDAG